MRGAMDVSLLWWSVPSSQWEAVLPHSEPWKARSRPRLSQLDGAIKPRTVLGKSESFVVINMARDCKSILCSEKCNCAALTSAPAGSC